jgi:hypothetical protein
MLPRLPRIKETYGFTIAPGSFEPYQGVSPNEVKFKDLKKEEKRQEKLKSDAEILHSKRVEKMKNRKKAESKPRADRMTPQQRRKRKWEMEQEDLAEYSKEFNLKKRLRKGETYSRIGLVRS